MQPVCLYYQASITKERVLYVVSILKSFDHLCFDRSIDVGRSRFEFFVPAANEKTFLALMCMFEREGIVSDIAPMSNRLLDARESL